MIYNIESNILFLILYLFICFLFVYYRYKTKIRYELDNKIKSNNTIKYNYNKVIESNYNYDDNMMNFLFSTDESDRSDKSKWDDINNFIKNTSKFKINKIINTYDIIDQSNVYNKYNISKTKIGNILIKRNNNYVICVNNKNNYLKTYHFSTNPPMINCVDYRKKINDDEIDNVINSCN